MSALFQAEEKDIQDWKCLFLDYLRSENLKFNKSYENILLLCGRNLDLVGNPSKYALCGYDIEDIGPPDFIYDETDTRITRRLVHRKLYTFDQFKSVALGHGDFHREFDVALFSTITPYIRNANYFYDINIEIKNPSKCINYRGPVRQFYSDCLRNGLITHNYMFRILCGDPIKITINRLEKIK